MSDYGLSIKKLPNMKKQFFTWSLNLNSIKKYFKNMFITLIYVARNLLFLPKTQVSNDPDLSFTKYLK